MIMQGHLDINGDISAVKNLPFVPRKYIETPVLPFELIDPNDFRRYPNMELDHYSGDAIEEMFAVVCQFDWLINKVYAVHRLTPGSVLPLHKDCYPQYKKNHDIIDDGVIYRVIVFLEDWQYGHILQVGSRMYSSWRRGDFVVWQGAQPHMAANLGQTDRYTLQITGTHDF